MKFKRNLVIVASVITVGILFFIVTGGTHNNPYETQPEYDEVELIKDPESLSPFDFDFEFPSFDALGGIFGLGEGALFLIVIVSALMFLLVVGSFVIYRRRRDNEIIIVEENLDENEKDAEITIRHHTLGRRIGEILIFLQSCLDERYSQGIKEGFERLDMALKEYSKISRPGWLTPREYTRLNIPYFNHQKLTSAVEQFYRVTYGEKEANREELEEFIASFQGMIIDPEILSWEADAEGSR